MHIQHLYHSYLNMKYNRALPLLETRPFEYALCEDGGAELFFTDHPEETFAEWLSELQPRDPNYVANPDWKPMLHEQFAQLDVYEELILYYLLYTINATTSIASLNPYNAMNDFMKNYAFFQLNPLTGISRLSDEQKGQLREFFFFFYLYAHPVNEETLYAFSFKGHTLVHNKTNIEVERYISAFHDHCIHNFADFEDQLSILPSNIKACKQLTLELLRSIEGHAPKLTMPPEEGIEPILRLINDVDEMLRMHSENNAELFAVMRDFMENNPGASTPYSEHCFRILLQNYVSYILFFNFDAIRDLVKYFKDDPLWGKTIINHMFTDAILIQKIMRQLRIDLAFYPEVTALFEEQARRIYL
ncbi:hypothetical protein [Paenibacillus sp. JJ-223]|uniref:hypothetical protein n=1 Tax=Paenibacillus sp. JJ-223 TaxID=2905647 RepID=UPI001F36642F|nr:hypothetical protein [Paenibacillus sp. JJ-223]CAH1197112.1 hypothetical protein PAECIP111890_01136 [Paenibacillus sp. JJ-223]